MLKTAPDTICTDCLRVIDFPKLEKQPPYVIERFIENGECPQCQKAYLTDYDKELEF
jgi:hypothetical protein